MRILPNDVTETLELIVSTGDVTEESDYNVVNTEISLFGRGEGHLVYSTVDTLKESFKRIYLELKLDHFYDLNVPNCSKCAIS